MVLKALAPSDDPQMLGRLGPYEVSAVIGEGGMGVVLKGHDRALGRIVATESASSLPRDQWFGTPAFLS